MSARTQLMAQHPRGDDVYKNMVRITYPQIRASVPLMITPERVAREQAADDAVAAGLIDWLQEHTRGRTEPR